MRFTLIDRIIEFAPGERIVAVKAVSLAEEYLADHFPTFPVLPGVLMLEAMVEAARWLVLESRRFAPAVILLETAKNVTYKNFVRPGNVLRVDVTCRGLRPNDSDFLGVGYCGESESVRGRFSLVHHPWDRAGRHRATARVDESGLVDSLRERFAMLGF